MKTLENCPVCNIEFTPAHPERKNKIHFCSPSCYQKSRIRAVIKTCPFCNKEFNSADKQRDTQIFCSRDCLNKNRRVLLEVRSCPICNKDFNPWPKRGYSQVYCSRPCYAIGKSKQVQLVCERCGKSFSTAEKLSKRTRYCSWDCVSHINALCPICGVSFTPSFPGGIKQRCCGHACAVKWRQAHPVTPSLGHEVTPEARAAVSAGLKRYFNNDPTKHWHWQGGYDGWRGQSWRANRKLARERDGNTCRVCGKTEQDIGKRLSVHHIIPFKKIALADVANQLSNLVTVCQSCHMKLEYGKISLPALS